LGRWNFIQNFFIGKNVDVLSKASMSRILLQLKGFPKVALPTDEPQP
jgi:hypothetical protein